MLQLLRSLIKLSFVCISEVATAAMHTMSVGVFVHLSVLFELRFREFQLAFCLAAISRVVPRRKCFVHCLSCWMVTFL